MKYIILIFTIIIFATNIGRAAEPLCAYVVDGVWHVVDEIGKEILTLKDSSSIKGFSEGYYLVSYEKDGYERWKFISRDGKKTIETDGMLAGLFKDGRARVHFFTDPIGTAQQIGFIDTSGKFIVEPDYLDVVDYSEGVAWVMNDEERGYVDHDGKFVLKLPKDTLWMGNEFSEGLAGIHNAKGYSGYIDKTGKVVIDFKYHEANPFKDGLARVNLNLVYGYINHLGETVLPHEFEYAMDFADNSAFIGTYNTKQQPVWGIIDRSGGKVRDFEYTKVRDFSEGIGTVLIDDKWYFIDEFGTKVIDRGFDLAGRFKNGLAWAAERDEGKFGFINYLGEFEVLLPVTDMYVDMRFNQPF